MSVLQQVRTHTGSRIPGTGNWKSVQTIDMHTGGEPLRVILNGYPQLVGDSVLARRRDARQNHDWLRTALMFEPRGHADMYGCVLVDPEDNGADFGILFLHNEGYSTMCGHAIIAISKLVFQMGWKSFEDGKDQGQLTIDAPCGRIISFTENNAGKPGRVRFHCVPSFVVGLDRLVDVAGFGQVTYDLAYGGAFYAYVDLRKNQLGFEIQKSDYRKIVEAGISIKHAVAKSEDGIIHPFQDDLSFLYGTIFISDPVDRNSSESGIDSRNVCVFADGEVDRCPTGSGVSGRIAIHAARNEIGGEESMRIESIVDSVFTGSIVRWTTFGHHKAVVPEVSGDAHVTGPHTFLIDPDDPLGHGFLL